MSISIAQAIKDVIAYMASRDNPAQVTARQLGSYSQAEVNNMLSKYLTTGTFGVDKYGDNSWTPPNVLGSFEGGARSESIPNYAMLEEPNGDFCLLENGTNGVKSSAYYTFFKPNPDGTTLTHNPTPRRYEPPLLAKNAGHRVFQVYNSEGRDVVWGQLINESTLATKMFVTLTGGTMDASQHVGAIISPTPSGVDRNSRMVMVRDKLYLLAFDNQTQFSVWTANVADVRNNDTVSFTQVTGWSTVGINGRTITGSTIKYAAMFNSPDSSVDSCVFYDTNTQSVNDYPSRQWTAVHPTDSKLRMVYQRGIWFNYPGGGAIVAGLTFVMDIDFSAKTATVLPETRHRINLQNGANGTVAQDTVSAGISAQYGNVPGQVQGTVCVSAGGKQLIIQYPGLGLGVYNYGPMGKASTLTPWDKLHPNGYKFEATTTAVLYRRFGSLVGSGIYIKCALPGSKMLIGTTSDYLNPDARPVSNNVLIGAAGSYNSFSYNTDEGTCLGYPPTTDRVVARNFLTSWNLSTLCTGAGKTITKIGMSPISPDNGITESIVEAVVSGDSLISAGKGTIKADLPAFAALKSKAITDAASNFSSTSGLTTAAELWFPPIGGKRTYPALARVQVFSLTERKVVDLCYQVNVSFSSGSSTAGGVIAGITATQLLNTRAEGNILALNYNSRAGGFVYEHCDSSGNLLYSIVYTPCGLNTSTVGGSGGNQCETVILPSEGSYNPSYSRHRRSATWNTGYDPLFLVEGVGPVYADFARSQRAGSAGIYYRKLKLGTARDDWWNVAYDPNDSKYYIWVCAQVAEGYNLYFTDDTPSLIDGKYYLVPAGQYDLRDIVADPSSKTFYVWLRLLNGAVSYVITPNNQDNYDLYIGKIITNNTQIDSINIQKATVFNW